MVTGTTTGCLSLLYTNQPDLYDIKIHALLTNANGEVIWEADGDPVSYTQPAWTCRARSAWCRRYPIPRSPAAS